MIYGYIETLITTLFVDPTTLSPEAALFLELLMLWLAASVLRFMFSPIAYLFKIASMTFQAIGGPKKRMRVRNMFKDED